jgi:hypothetical protein
MGVALTNAKEAAATPQRVEKYILTEVKTSGGEDELDVKCIEKDQVIVRVLECLRV